MSCKRFFASFHQYPKHNDACYGGYTTNPVFYFLTARGRQHLAICLFLAKY
jgi:hypothetical protein